MAKIETTIEEIKKNGLLLEDYLGYDIQNGESELIVKNGKIYKIIEGVYRKKKQRVMEFLHDESNHLSLEIADLFYEKGLFFSYSRPFYEEYPTLYEVLKSDISLEERKQIDLELIRIYEEFLSYHLVYYDWHSKNGLYKENLKLLDIDSSQMTTAIQFDLKARQNLFHLCIEILLGEDFDYDWNLESRKIKDIVDELINKEEMFLSEMAPLSFSFMKKIIQNYTYLKVEEQKEWLRKRILQN